MIVACTSCSVQYTVPDAKVRGRKVRVTCKHCRTSFVIDGTEPPRERLRLPDLPALIGTDAGDDEGRVASRAAFSVHDEPTVVGQIPAAALEAERRYAQRTVPPPGNPPATSPAGELTPRASASDSPASTTRERTLPPHAGHPAALESRLEPNRKRTTYLLVALATVLVTAAVIVLTTR